MLRKLFGPMSQCASHATEDMDIWLLSLCAWQSGAWCSKSRWWLAGFSAGSRERCNRSTLVEIKGRASEHCASEPSTAGHSRMRTNEPHMSKPERHIDIVFRRDEGCGHHVTHHACCHDMLLHVAGRDQAAVIQVERQAVSQRSEWSIAPKSR